MRNAAIAAARTRLTTASLRARIVSDASSGPPFMKLTRVRPLSLKTCDGTLQETSS